ncbi:TPA: hypothetical protein KKM22_001154 [Escherichia coli]|uniref:hypothetical protein n=1 Tax=Escherichia coli TaxID=562 RepID=UPI000B002866|nr:hypothetical protein [Escherichia coli]HBP1425026.1 hypothetical protein [Escherichia coli str. K-12 substr. MG1655star]EIH7479341.1 hypothetical protein [Escherichia coli]EIY8184729.1 hypothetical protein [Escherichia coli]MBB0824305.1 hypothetical protein [Escherichia coli]TYE59318.1 hypothetical protein DJ491_16340 [Escherichia coli]
MIEDGIYAATLIDEMSYRVEGDDIRVSIDSGEWRKPFIETTREHVKIMLDNGDLVRVSDL